MIDILSPREIDAMRPAGAFVGTTLRTLRDRVEPGVDLLDIDRWATQLIAERGAVSSYVDYAPSFGRGPFGKVICISVNDAVLHGLPHRYRLRDGDLLTLDFAVSVDGWVADAAISFTVGDIADPADVAMIDTTELALQTAIELAVPGGKTGDLSAAIGGVLGGAGYPINMDFGGHGVGRTMHQDPHIANDGRPGRGVKLRAGLVLAIEPWVMADTDELVTDPDGWTLRSATGARTAHSEHTVAITDDGPIVLTLPQE